MIGVYNYMMIGITFHQAGPADNNYNNNDPEIIIIIIEKTISRALMKKIITMIILIIIMTQAGSPAYPAFLFPREPQHGEKHLELKSREMTMKMILDQKAF